jgi:hypothetical protein
MRMVNIILPPQESRMARSGTITSIETRKFNGCILLFCRAGAGRVLTVIVSAHNDVRAHFELPINLSSTKLNNSDFVSCSAAERNFKSIVYLLQKHCNEPSKPE